LDLRSDEELMLAAGREDEQAFALLVGRYRLRAIRFGVRMVGDVPTAEDIAQEAFTRLYLLRSRYRARARFSTLLYTVLKNLAVDELRRRSRWPRAADQATRQLQRRGSDLGHSDPVAQIADGNPGAQPERAALLRDTAAAVARAVSGLTPDHRAAIMLRQFEELEYRQIADVMGWTLAKTKVTLHRARQQLAAALAEEDLDIEDN
jgi:RNA polymerase sigma-70 factor, ECF subfamily